MYHCFKNSSSRVAPASRFEPLAGKFPEGVLERCVSFTLPLFPSVSDLRVCRPRNRACILEMAMISSGSWGWINRGACRIRHFLPHCKRNILGFSGVESMFPFSSVCAIHTCKHAHIHKYIHAYTYLCSRWSVFVSNSMVWTGLRGFHTRRVFYHYVVGRTENTDAGQRSCVCQGSPPLWQLRRGRGWLFHLSWCSARGGERVMWREKRGCSTDCGILYQMSLNIRTSCSRWKAQCRKSSAARAIYHHRSTHGASDDRMQQ